jgi:DNA-binding NarL/FixJ family response regulator
MRVMIIDEYPLVQTGIETLIRTLDDGVDIISVGSGQAARLVLLQQQDFDLILLDLNLGDINGYDLLAYLRHDYPHLAVVVVSDADEASDVIRALDMGVMGHISKRAERDTLVNGLRQVLNGSIYVPPIKPAETRLNKPAEWVSSHGATHHFGLTPRQQQVLSLLLKGLPNKLIARALNLSVETVKDHVAAVLRALKVNSRTQAVIAVSQMAPHQLSSRMQEAVGEWHFDR